MIDNLTLEEKVRLVTGVGMWHTYDANGKVKSCHLSDGPHGVRKQEEGNRDNNDSVRATCFPTACAVAASWNVEAARKMANAIAKEAIAEGVAVVLGPGTNIKRSPTCGRNFEYYSEDPYLAGMLATAYIEMMQSMGVGTSIKHFAANNQETFRMTGNSRVDERTLREIYLSAFEMAVKNAQPATIMASYNQINGVYSTENKWLLTDVLRNEWGFEGLVVSDWGACSRLSESVEAGMDLEMPDASRNHTHRLLADVKSGKVSQESLDRAVSLVVKMSEKYARDPQNLTDNEKKNILDENHQIAVELESECAVLLKNEGVLPIVINSDIEQGDLKESTQTADKKTEQDVIVIGSMAENVRIQGGGSSHINTDNVPTALEALLGEGVRAQYVKGYDDMSLVPDAELEAKAIEAVSKAAVENKPVIFIGGLTDLAEGEGYDREKFEMPENQASLLSKLCDVNDKVIFVAFGGSPFDMSPADKAGAILMMYLGGEGVMEAMSKILTGKVNPSGKLPESYPYKYEDIPCYGNYATSSRNADYREGLLVGYRYYDTLNKSVRYPFGYGLSYTSFEYNDICATKCDDGVKVYLSVKNTGNFDGYETVQIYVKNPEINNMFRAKRELRGFEKVFLKAGEEKAVCVTLPDRAFEIYDVKAKSYAVVPGEYELQAASSLSDVRCSTAFVIEGDNIPFGEKPDFDELKKTMGDLDHISDGQYTIQNSLGQLSKKSLIGKVMYKVAKKEAIKMAGDKSVDDPEVKMYVEAALEGTIDSVLNNAGDMVPYKIGEAIVLSANGHKLKAVKKLLTK